MNSRGPAPFGWSRTATGLVPAPEEARILFVARALAAKRGFDVVAEVFRGKDIRARGGRNWSADGLKKAIATAEREGLLDAPPKPTEDPASMAPPPLEDIQKRLLAAERVLARLTGKRVAEVDRELRDGGSELVVHDPRLKRAVSACATFLGRPDDEVELMLEEEGEGWEHPLGDALANVIRDADAGLRGALGDGPEWNDPGAAVELSLSVQGAIERLETGSTIVRALALALGSEEGYDTMRIAIHDAARAGAAAVTTLILSAVPVLAGAAGWLPPKREAKDAGAALALVRKWMPDGLLDEEVNPKAKERRMRAFEAMSDVEPEHLPEPVAGAFSDYLRGQLTIARWRAALSRLDAEAPAGAETPRDKRAAAREKEKLARAERGPVS